MQSSMSEAARQKYTLGSPARPASVKPDVGEYAAAVTITVIPNRPEPSHGKTGIFYKENHTDSFSWTFSTLKVAQWRPRIHIPAVMRRQDPVLR